jgi:L-asparaginase II
VGSIGIVVKVADGNAKVKEMMMMNVLNKLNLLTEEEKKTLSVFSDPTPLFNVAGTKIGEQKVCF